MVTISKPDFIKEHKHLIELLRKFKDPRLLAEAASQEKELSEVLTGGKALKDKYFGSYTSEMIRVLELITFGDKVEIIGSASLRSMLYSADVDADELVEMHRSTDAAALRALVKQFQSMIAVIRRTPDIYFSDFKSGEVPEWKILDDAITIKDGKVVGYNQKDCLAKVNHLLEKNIITPSEGLAARKLLPPTLSLADFALAKDELKFHIIRWSVFEIAKNRKVLRDGRVVTLEFTFASPSLSKLDVISLIGHTRFVEFSIIYQFSNKGRPLNPLPDEDIAKNLREDVELYKAKGNYFKALKREFALEVFTHKSDTKKMYDLIEIFNSDLGRLYSVITDISTLLEVLTTTAPLKDIKLVVDNFKARLANVWDTDSFLKLLPLVHKDLKAILIAPRTKIKAPLERLGDRLYEVLQDEAKKYI